MWNNTFPLELVLSRTLNFPSVFYDCVRRYDRLKCLRQIMLFYVKYVSISERRRLFCVHLPEAKYTIQQHLCYSTTLVIWIMRLRQINK